MGDRTTRTIAAAVLTMVAALALLTVAIHFLGEMVSGDTVPAHAQGDSAADARAAVEKLAARLRQRPNDGEGWALLARSYAATGQFDRAVEAFARARRLLGDRPALLVDYADAMAMAAGGRMAGQPATLVRLALKAEPRQPKGLWLAGMAAVEEGRFQDAADLWHRLLPQLDPAGADAAELRRKLAKVEAHLRADSAPAGAAGDRVAAPDTGRAGAVVHVRLAAALADRVRPDDAVFVYARAESGSPMPVAAVRRRASDLPFTVRLDDGAAVLPGRKLSDVAKIVVGARISRTGSATPHRGDLEGRSGPLRASDAGDVDVLIDTAVR